VATEEVTSDSSLTEVADEVTTETTTPAAAEPAQETNITSPLDTLYQKLNVKGEDEILERLNELQSLKESKTLGKLIDDLSAKGVDPVTAITFHNLDIEKLSPKERIAWNTKMQHPTLSDDQISALIEEEYGDDTNLAQQAKLTIAGEAAGKELAERKVKVLNPTLANNENAAKQKEAEQVEAKRVEAWKSTPKIKEVLSTVGKINQKVTFSTFGEDKPVNKSFDFSYQIPKEGLADVEAALRNIAVAQGMDPNAPESYAALNEAAVNIFKIQNFEKAISSAFNTAASHFHKENAQRYHNANPNRGGVGIDTGKKTGADARVEATINALGK